MPTTTTAPPLTVNALAQLTLAFHQLDYRRADEMLNDSEGATLIALLCNASAKLDPAFYLFKSRLLRWAVEHASDWWATPQLSAYGEDYETDTVIYIQHGETRFAFHVRASDEHLAALLADAPRSERGWTGRALQPIARQLAADWLARARVPFDRSDQR